MRTITPEQGMKLRDRRQALGLTQLELAQAAGITRSYVAQVELGMRTAPSAKIMERWSQALGWPTNAMAKIVGKPTVEATAASNYRIYLDEALMAEIDRLIEVKVNERVEKMLARWFEDPTVAKSLANIGLMQIEPARGDRPLTNAGPSPVPARSPRPPLVSSSQPPVPASSHEKRGR